MAEPIGVLGTAVGVVSLGLQVYGSLKWYLDAYGSRDDQVSKVLEQLTLLHQVLDEIKDVIPDVESEQRVTSEAVKSSLTVTRAELVVLQNELLKHKATNTTDFKGKMKDVGRRLRYPFARAELEDLSQRLHRILKSLSLAMSGLGLRSLASISHQITDLNTTVQDQATTFSQLVDGSNALMAAQSASTTQIVEIHRYTKSLGPKIDHLGQETTSQLLSLEAKVDSHLTRLEDKMNTLLLSNAGALSECGVSNGDIILGRLLSKPSLLRDMHEIADAVTTSAESPFLQQSTEDQSPRRNISQSRFYARSGYVCKCKSYKSTQENTSVHFGFMFRGRTETSNRHRPTCSLYNPRQTQRKQAYDITLSGFRNVLSIALTAGLRFDYGAGGLSIGPVFKYFPMVDHERSAPFIIMSRLSSSLIFLGPEDADILLHMSLSKVKNIYDRGRAHINDVDEFGRTLLDFALFHTAPLGSNILRNHHVLPQITSSFLGLGITSRNQQGLVYRIRDQDDGNNESFHNFSTAITSLLDENPECSFQWTANKFPFLRSRRFLCNHAPLREVLGLDELCTSLLYHDKEALKTSLDKAKFLNDLDGYIFKTVLIRLAVQWPIGLRMIIPHFFDTNSANSSFQSLALADFIKEITACVFIDPGHDCVCSEILGVLLESDFSLETSSVYHILSARPTYGRPCPKMALVLLQNLRTHQQALANYYREVFPSHPVVPDIEVPSMVSQLESFGKFPHTVLGLKRGDFRLGCRETEELSIYHYINSEHIAQLAYDVGFRDVDDAYAQTPLATALRTGHWTYDYVHWLIAHGADTSRQVQWYCWDYDAGTAELILRPTFSLPRHNIAHLAARKAWYDDDIDKLTNEHTIAHLALSSTCGWEIADGCSCACTSTETGCSGLTILLNACPRAPADLSPNEMVLFDSILDFVAAKNLITEAIRVLTFNALDIKHTCCITIGDDRVVPPDWAEDFEEIRAEYADRVLMLEELVEGIVQEYQEGDISLSQFVYGPWTDKMRDIQTQETEARWSTSQQQALREIGVVPKMAVEDTGENQKPRAGVERRYFDLDYWVRELERL
ncbi:hypothetical protein GGR57DRAFT_466046 [Xylariaceae sp. FL1272]|nr:hypothetical protein GGR57DRAFT_466046 [Xylariaceae sp. FL1272]